MAGSRLCQASVSRLGGPSEVHGAAPHSRGPSQPSCSARAWAQGRRGCWLSSSTASYPRRPVSVCKGKVALSLPGEQKANTLGSQEPLRSDENLADHTSLGSARPAVAAWTPEPPSPVQKSRSHALQAEPGAHRQEVLKKVRFLSDKNKRQQALEPCGDGTGKGIL